MSIVGRDVAFPLAPEWITDTFIFGSSSVTRWSTIALRFSGFIVDDGENSAGGGIVTLLNCSALGGHSEFSKVTVR